MKCPIPGPRSRALVEADRRHLAPGGRIAFETRNPAVREWDSWTPALTREQIGLLIEAARADWTQVEPAIFGTLLERALDPRERHALGAHYTPRAYVERLVLPTVIEPLRDSWRFVQAAALVLASEDNLIRGASGVAVQNFNRMYGHEERTALL